MNRGLKDRSLPSHNQPSAGFVEDSSSEQQPAAVLGPAALQQLLAQPFPAGHEEMMLQIRKHVRQVIDQQLASGHNAYYGGTGADAGRLYLRTPDGRRFEYRVHSDGTREMVRELPS